MNDHEMIEKIYDIALTTRLIGNIIVGSSIGLIIGFILIAIFK